MFKYSDVLIKKKNKLYSFRWEILAAQMERQEEPGGNLTGKSLQPVQLIKQSSENLIVVLCSEQSSALLWSPHSYCSITSFDLIRQHIDDKYGKKINIYYSAKLHSS